MARRGNSGRSSGPGISFFAFQDIITAVVGIFILITLILVLELAQRVECASTALPTDIKPIVETIATLKQQVAEMQVEITKRTDAMTASQGLNAFNLTEKVNSLKNENAGLEARLQTSVARTKQLSSQVVAADRAAQVLADQAADLSGEREELAELAKVIQQVQQQTNVLLGDNTPIYREKTSVGRYLTLVTLSSGVIEIRDALTRSAKRFRGTDRTKRWEDWLDQIPLDRRHLLIRIQPGGEADFPTVRDAADQRSAMYGYTVVGEKEMARLSHELP